MAQCPGGIITTEGESMMRVVVPDDIATRADGFVGREWVLDEVIDWMDHGELTLLPHYGRARLWEDSVERLAGGRRDVDL